MDIQLRVEGRIDSELLILELVIGGAWLEVNGKVTIEVHAGVTAVRIGAIVSDEFEFTAVDNNDVANAFIKLDSESTEGAR